MSDPKKPTDDAARPGKAPGGDRLEAYLDGLLNDAEAAAFAAALRSNSALRQQADLQARIDGALGRLFHVEAPSHEAVAAALAGALDDGAVRPRGDGPGASPSPMTPASVTPVVVAKHAPPPSPRLTRRYWAAAVLTAAAGLAYVLATVPWGAGRPGPLFAARPMVELYDDAVTSGFEPTYECHDPKLFADTFLQRQGTPLKLLAMPPGTQMLGLAYVGGLSRQTTAMLCRVDGQPVMVFVDRAAADQAIAPDLGDAKLRVFRQERDGLVYYEVTPLAEPRVMEFLAPTSASADGKTPA